MPEHSSVRIKVWARVGFIGNQIDREREREKEGRCSAGLVARGANHARASKDRHLFLLKTQIVDNDDDDSIDDVAPACHEQRGERNMSVSVIYRIYCSLFPFRMDADNYPVRFRAAAATAASNICTRIVHPHDKWLLMRRRKRCTYECINLVIRDVDECSVGSCLSEYLSRSPYTTAPLYLAEKNTVMRMCKSADTHLH